MEFTAVLAEGAPAGAPPVERWFLSEMSVSNGHGGGLTLQRILGESLNHFAGFVHPGRFGKAVPAAPAYQARSLHLPMALETDAARRFLGYRPTGMLAGLSVVRDGYAERVAEKLAASKTPRRWLVCPQADLSLRIIERLKRRGPLEYVTWIMDDHLARFDMAAGSWRYRPEHHDLLRAHLRGAEAVFVISPVMQEFYAREFGVESTVLFGPGDPANEPVWSAPTPPSEPVRLGYFGAVGPWQNDALALLLPTVAAGEAVLDVFSAHPLPPDWPRATGLCHRAPLPAAGVPAAMRGCDAVVLPISFLPDMANMTRLNIATKMAECLASGTVVLLIGPPEAAMTRILRGTGAAMLITDPSSEAVRAKLAELRGRFQTPGHAGRRAAVVSGERHRRHHADRWRRGTHSLFP